LAWQDRTARPRILGVVILISCGVALQQASAFYITKNTRPKLYAVAEHHGIGVGRTLVGAGKDVPKPPR